MKQLQKRLNTISFDVTDTVLKNSCGAFFDRASKTYNTHNDVQRQVFDTFRSQFSGQSYGSFLDIGSGTGEFTSLLQGDVQASRVVGIDLSDAMIAEAQRLNLHSGIQFTHSDILDFKSDKAFDLLVSHSTLHWISALSPLFDHCHALMKPGSDFYFSVFLPSSLSTLSEAGRAVMGPSFSLICEQFHSTEDYEQALSSSFSSFSVDVKRFSLSYPSLIDFFRTVKGAGVRGIQNDRIWTKSHIQAIEARLKESKADTFELFYDVAFFRCRY